MTYPIAPLLKRFFSHYLPVLKGVSVNTVMAYRDATKLFLCYAADALGKPVDVLTVEDLNEKCVLGFLDDIEKKRGCSKRTRNARLAAIKSLFGFIAREEPVLALQSQQIRGIPLKRTEHKMIEYLEEKEMQGLFDAVEVHSRTGLRDRALLLLMYNTGARVSEMLQLQLHDLHLEATGQARLHGKGRKERSCPLWPETVAAVKAYLQRRTPEEPGTDQVFLNANGRPITRFGIRHVTRKYGVQARTTCRTIGTKPVNPHRLRHTTAMHLLRAGNDINMVSYWLGHADLNTTHVYIEIDMETKRKMLDKTSAPNIGKRSSWSKPSVLQWLAELTQHPELCEANYKQAIRPGGPTPKAKPTGEGVNST